ncbi:MAG TPA: LamG domain-containing protein, partial [Thermodesulfobacteriota bacterium]|nr:LamG domain-containing protein [Thermodesulfobacteriota bacterium]
MAFLSGWNFRKKLTIDSDYINKDLTDFPILVKLTDSNFPFNKADSLGTDINFTSDDGTTLLKFEREVYKTYTDDTLSGGTVSASSEEGVDPAVDAVNNTLGTSIWSSTNTGGVAWWQYDYGAGNEKTITRYDIWSTSSFSQAINDSPRDWTFEGSNTGAFAGEEDILDTQTGIAWAGGQELKIFRIDNLTAYRYYRLNVTATLANARVRVAEFEFLETADSANQEAYYWVKVPSLSGHNYEAHYTLNDNAANTTVIDNTGEHNAVATSNTSTLTTTGKINEGFDLTSSDYITVGTDEDFNFNDDDFTIACWFKKSSVTTEDVIIAKRDWVLGTEDGYSIGLTSATNLRVHYFTDQDYTISAIDDNNWHHLAVVFDYTNSQTTVYLDNSLVNTLSHTQDIQNNTNPLYIGRSNNASPILPFDGHLDDFRIIRANLDSTAISNIYNGGSGTEDLLAPENFIYLYYGNDVASDAEDPTNVWDSNYSAVYHLENEGLLAIDGNNDEATDSTANAHHGTGSSSMTSADFIYKGQYNSGGFEDITVSDSDDFYFDADFTLEWKMRWVGSVTTGSIMGQSEGGGVQPKWFINFQFAVANTLHFDFVNGGEIRLDFAWTPSADTDYHCMLKREGNDFKFYVNGVQVGGTQTNATALLNVASNFTLFNEGEGFQWFSGVMDEVRITKGLARDDSYKRAAYNSDIDNLFTFGAEEEAFTFVDIATDIRAVHTESLTDINTDIRTIKQEFLDIDTDIRAAATEATIDIDTDIRAIAPAFVDIDTDIRTQPTPVFVDIDTDIRALQSVFVDINTDIHTVFENFADINTDIRAFHTLNQSQVQILELSFEEGFYLSSDQVTILMDVFGAVKVQFRNEDTATW